MAYWLLWHFLPPLKSGSSIWISSVDVSLRLFALLICTISSLFLHCAAGLPFCPHQDIVVRRGSYLAQPLRCCSYSALFKTDYINLTVRWKLDGGIREATRTCFKPRLPNRNSVELFFSGNDSVDSTLLLNNSANSLSFGSGEVFDMTTTALPAPPCSNILPTQWDVNETDSMSLSFRKPLLLEDAGHYDCQTIIDGNTYTSSITLTVRESLPMDVERPVVPQVSGENGGNFTVKVCWNGSQWPQQFDPVTTYEVRIFRELDNTLVSSSGRIDASSKSLSFQESIKWDRIHWPFISMCCCWEVPASNLRPFSTYLATYRAFSEDKKVPLRSETNFSNNTQFTTPGMAAPPASAKLLYLDPYGSAATVQFSVRPIIGESPVMHHLNITVSKPNARHFTFSDRMVIQQDMNEINKTIDDLKPFTRYIVKAFVINDVGVSEATNITFVTLPGDLDTIKSLRAETNTTTSLSLKFSKPLFEDTLSIPNFSLRFSYSIAYEILRPDLSSSICPTLDDLCSFKSVLSYDRPDCYCFTIAASSRYMDEQFPITSLRPNRPYRISVRQFFFSNQIAPYNLLWPETIYAPWTSLSRRGYVFTDSISISTPPHLRNVTLSVLADNSTAFILSFSIIAELSIKINWFESVWAIDFRCGNWSKVIALKSFVESDRTDYFTKAAGVVTEEVSFQIDQSEEYFPEDKCWLHACPMTRSRRNVSFTGSVGPCSKESILIMLPDRQDATLTHDALAQRQHAISALVSAIVVTIVVIAIVGVVLYFLKRKRWLCLGRKLIRSPNRRESNDHRPTSPVGIQLLPRNSSSRHNSAALQKRLSSISNEGPFAGSMFCYKVASASFADFAQEFTSVCSMAIAESKRLQYSTKEAEQQANIGKNRYTNVLPYDHSRVTLGSVVPTANGSDYINANYVHGSDQNFQSYIAAQGPLPWTVADFWQMAWEQKVSKIVMLTDLVESPHESVRKCAPYWPKNIAQAAIYKNFRVILMRQRQRPFWIERVFELSVLTDETKEEDETRRSITSNGTNRNSARLVMHFQFTDWPDHGVPSAALPLLRFTQKVMADSCLVTMDCNNSPPMVVHCSAGIGRSGVFMVLCNELQRLSSKCQLDPAGCLISMRRYRPGLVQTPEQFRFIYLALYEAVRAQEVGDHSGLGVPTEPNRLQAWLKFDMEHGSKICDWATSRVPQMQNVSPSQLVDEFAFGMPSYYGSADNTSNALSSYYLPGPLHSRQIVILTTAEIAFISQRLRIWAMSSPSSDKTSSNSSLTGIHLVFVDGNVAENNAQELADHFRRNFPRIGVTSVALANWPPADPSRIFSSIIPALLTTSTISTDRPLSPSGSGEDMHNAVVEYRHPSVVIVTPHVNPHQLHVASSSTSLSDLTALSVAAELAVALECLSEARLTFSVDADPDPDGHVDLLLFGRIATLSLPQGALTRSGLQRALSLVAASNITNNYTSSLSIGSVASGGSRTASPANGNGPKHPSVASSVGNISDSR